MNSPGNPSRENSRNGKQRRRRAAAGWTNPRDIPDPVARRLSLYLRQLEAMRSEGKTISSKQLGDKLNLTDAQVRKDLAYFGQFGNPGIGYVIDELVQRLRRILGTDRVWNVLLVGMGNLGAALAAYRGFEKKGFRLVAVFDADPNKTGRPVTVLDGVRVQPLSELSDTVNRLDVQLAIVAVPAEAGQQAADALIHAGIKGLLNFAPISLVTPPHVAVSSVDMAVQLEQLSFRVGCMLEGGG